MKNSIIALIDCDSFFVSCEQAIDENLKGKPVCVMGSNASIIVARSKEAKKMGVKMGMPYFMAKKEYPDAIYISGNMQVYKDFSRKIMKILRDFSPTVEVYSIDEAFVDLTGLRKLYKKNYYGIAQLIRNRIKTEVGVNVSIGISKSKVLAKLACETAKSETSTGIYIIGQRKIPKLLKTTQIGKIWGIGRNTEKMFNRWGVLECIELVEKSDYWLKTRGGKNAVELKHELLGECIDRVKAERKLPKSIQNTLSFPKFTSDISYIKNQLNIHIHTSCTRLRRIRCKCKTVSVMLRTKDFRVYWEKANFDNFVNFELEISQIAMKLLDKLYNPELIYRSCGVTLSNFECNEESQLNLFFESNGKNFDKLADAIDKLESKFGKNIVKTGFLG